MPLHNENLKPLVWAKILGGATIIGLELGLIGPFGSYPANFFTRTAFWVILFWIGSLIIWPTVAWALVMGPRRGFPLLFSASAALIFSCIPLAAIAAAGCRLFWPLRASGMRGVEFYGLTLVVAGPSTALIAWLVRGAPKETGLPSLIAPAAAERSIAFHTTIPAHLIETALCLQMEDHHVRIHLQGRSMLHLVPMRKAIETLGDQRGVQVHRSWWVADGAVADWVDDGRSTSLILVNGLKVPVSRNRLAAVKARGLIGDTD
ncbi:hypothetical protein FHS31_002678 [Sphingomonas vulcanisoli]|uniref:HTH LytTR-type domain-containing protein n=1 Tax=Sphingomonas vulcanisoli TaxID=1658060 RepID=A0ABX0TVK4_9SPHN|nr:LytTR family transcriptional regulator DNA-binding domain-containing protein [Sphingomonas vulcanisoli]NIJ09048.1 hypothetical protein [Sphingomonas vulcanisoli]